MAGGGMDHHPHRLVDHDHILILIDHIQRDVLGEGLDRLRIGKGHHIDLPRLGLPVFLHRFPA